MTLKLVTLEISLNNWGDNKGKYTGKIVYEHQSSAVTLALDPSISDRLLTVIGPMVTAAASVVTKELEQAIAQGLEESRAVALIAPCPTNETTS